MLRMAFGCLRGDRSLYSRTCSLFINDMPVVISDLSTLVLFADDAKCFRAINSHMDFFAL